MAVPSQKRPLHTASTTTKAKKRRKVDSKKEVIHASALPWKSISMPDHLDDYEGFMGLEEIDDIEIVRDSETGQVVFRAEAAKKETSQGPAAPPPADEWSGFDDEAPPASSKSGSTKSKRVKTPHQANDEAAVSIKEQEWSGFDSDDATLSKTKPSKQSKPDTHSNAKAKKAKQPNGSKKAPLQPGFSMLSDSPQGSDEVDVSAWRALNLSADTLSSLSKLKFASPTPIQRSSIPEIRAGQDVIGKASTGSGKTLAFGIPILEAFLERRKTKDRQGPIALILSPTRELAHQLDKHLTALCSNGDFEGPSIATITGGLSVLKQQRQLKYADIVVGTPGRLWEVISDGKGVMKGLQGIQFLVIDEADRLLSDGHFKELEEILAALDRKDTNDEEIVQPEKATAVQRQTLIFSATFDRSLQHKLTNKSLPKNDAGELISNKESLAYLLSKLNFRSPDPPKFIDVNPINQLAANLKEGLVKCAGVEKDLYLYALLLFHPNTRVLVFTNSISAVRRLAPLLQHLNLPALPLHSAMPQKSRLRSVERFTATPDEPASSILVATDVAARGLDIPAVDLVIHYHVPRAADTYVHRSGRTARAGLEGTSILICSPEDVAGVRRLIGKVHASHSNGHEIRTLDIDRRIPGKLKPRVTLAKKIADAEMAKGKAGTGDAFLRAAAEELGVDFTSDEDTKQKGKTGRGKGRLKKEKEMRELSKSDMGRLKAELRGMLARRVNTGVSEKYLTGSGVDVDELLRTRELDGTEFLGSVRELWE